MDITGQIISIAGACIVSAGGIGAIIIGVIKFTSNSIADALSKKYELKLNKELELYKAGVENKIYIPEFLKLTETEQLLCLYEFINSYINEYVVSKYKSTMIIQAAVSRKPNWKMILVSPYQIVKAYDYLYICRANEKVSYEYILEEKGMLDTPYFRLDFRFESENRNVFDYDYPLTIRNYQLGDTFEVGGANKSVRRLFLDWKMPQELRNKWPVIVNKKGKIIYIPRYQENFIDDGNNNFVVKSKLGI